MLKRVLMVLVVVMLTLSFGTMVMADETKGTISAVGDKQVTIKSKDGTETTVKTSSKRTTVKGGALGDLKEGTKVTVTHDGKEASVIEIR